MDSLHTVLRSTHDEGSEVNARRRDHIDIFREFLDHLDRAARRKLLRPAKTAKLRERGPRR
jgi:hypothetical protein